MHDAGADTLLADLSAIAAGDMEVGPDGAVYLSAGSAIYRVDGAGALQLHATLPGFPFAVTLDSSAWGLVAAAVGRGASFYRVGADATLEMLHVTDPLTTIDTFAVDPAGRLCYDTRAPEGFTGFECRAPDGSIDPLAISGTGLSRLEFDDAGVLHFSSADNIYRLEGAAEVALLGSAAPVAGTLTVSAGTYTASGSTSYGYDARDQLTAVTRDGAPAESYSYDALGNRLADQRAGDYVYNELNELLSGNGAAYGYDASGNRLTRTDAAGTTAYHYDAEHCLTRIDLPAGGYAEYAYDPFGRRIQKRVVDAQGTETIRRYVYDGEDILFELDGNDALLTEFMHGPGIDEPLALRRNGQIYTYHADALGSIVAITDESGAIVQRYEYDAYGNITFVLDPAFAQPYGFTGREYDAESGLYYYRARYYDPEVGRFITRDPIGFAGGDVNLYAYVFGNPVSLVDPTGLDVCLESTNNANVPFGLHQRVAVYDSGGNFVYGQSFGTTNPNTGLSTSEGGGKPEDFSGEVYPDVRDSTKDKKKCTSSTDKQNKQIIAALQSQLGARGPYSATGIRGMSCRTYSSAVYNQIVKQLRGGR